MAEVDTSSYPKASMPVSPLDMASKFAGLEQQKLSIDQAKLNQANQGLQYMVRAMGALGPNATKDQYIDAAGTAVRMGLVPEQALEQFKQRAAASPTSKDFYNEFMTTAADHQQQIDYHLGRVGTSSTGQTETPVVVSPKPGFGVQPIAPPVQLQPPPTATAVGPGGTPTALGAQPPQLPPGAAPTGNLPGQFRMPVERPAAATPGPVTGPAIKGPSSNFGGNVVGANVEPPTNPATGAPIPRGYQAGNTPLFEEGKKQITEDQALASQRMTAVKPAIQALKLMQQPNFPSTGPITGKINELTAAAKALGIVDTKTLNDPTVLRQELEKKLAQYVGSSPGGQRSDAAQVLAEAGSPNPKHQILPALINLTRDSIILDRVQAARPSAFKGTNYDQYGNHRATFPQSIDERAFGLDLMPKEEAKKLTDTMYQKYSKNPRNPEALKFFHSLDIAKKQGFFNAEQE